MRTHCGKGHEYAVTGKYKTAMLPWGRCAQCARDYARARYVKAPPRPRRTECRRGHVYADVGFYERDNGAKLCKACQRIRYVNSRARR